MFRHVGARNHLVKPVTRISEFCNTSREYFGNFFRVNLYVRQVSNIFLYIRKYRRNQGTFSKKGGERGGRGERGKERRGRGEEEEKEEKEEEVHRKCWKKK